MQEHVHHWGGGNVQCAPTILFPPEEPQNLLPLKVGKSGQGVPIDCLSHRKQFHIQYLHNICTTTIHIAPTSTVNAFVWMR